MWRNLMGNLQHTSKLESDNILLRPIIESDYQSLYIWRNDTSSLFLWSQQRRLVSYSEFMRTVQQSDIDVWLMIINKISSAPVGFVYSFDAKPWDGHAFLAMYIDLSARGKRIGYEAGALFANYLFDYFPYEKLYADVFEFNSVSHSFMNNYGFVQEGYFPKHRYFQGKHWGVYRLALYKDIWDMRKQEIFSKITTNNHIS
jgi:RimJ/RimL family protein N-acetyltransferase